MSLQPATPCPHVSSCDLIWSLHGLGPASQFHLTEAPCLLFPEGTASPPHATLSKWLRPPPTHASPSEMLGSLASASHMPPDQGR